MLKLCFLLLWTIYIYVVQCQVAGRPLSTLAFGVRMQASNSFGVFDISDFSNWNLVQATDFPEIGELIGIAIHPYTQQVYVIGIDSSSPYQQRTLWKLNLTTWVGTKISNSVFPYASKLAFSCDYPDIIFIVSHNTQWNVNINTGNIQSTTNINPFQSCGDVDYYAFCYHPKEGLFYRMMDIECKGDSYSLAKINMTLSLVDRGGFQTNQANSQSLAWQDCFYSDQRNSLSILNNNYIAPISASQLPRDSIGQVAGNWNQLAVPHKACCPNSCNNQGNCNPSRSCSCTGGYLGNDCSVVATTKAGITTKSSTTEKLITSHSSITTHRLSSITTATTTGITTDNEVTTGEVLTTGEISTTTSISTNEISPTTTADTSTTNDVIYDSTTSELIATSSEITTGNQNIIITQTINNEDNNINSNNNNGISDNTKKLLIIVIPIGAFVVLFAIFLTVILLARKRSEQKRMSVRESRTGSSSSGENLVQERYSQRTQSDAELNLVDINLTHNVEGTPQISPRSLQGTPQLTPRNMEGTPQLTPRNMEGTPKGSPRIPVLPETSNWTVPYYELHFDKEIGRGAYGVVFQGKWKKTPVAIKQMRTDTMTSDERHSVINEIQTMIRVLPHPNVITLLGVCIRPLSIVTEFMENGNLHEYLNSKGGIPDIVLYNIVVGIARGMNHLHSEGICHRDLNSRNVLLTQSFQAKISDFGLARLSTGDVETSKRTIGSLRWMAPEVINDQMFSFKSDVWSFGLILCQIYSRMVPYGDQYNEITVAAKVAKGELTCDIPDDAPEFVKAIIESCLQYRGSQRPAFDAICQAIEMSNP